MRILYVSDVYFPRVNGVSTSIHTFRRELHALGHDIVLVAPAYPELSAVEETDIVRIESRAVPFDPEDRLMGTRALRRLPAAMGPRGFDLVHVQTPFAAHYAGVRMARELNVPCVATYHTFFEEYLHHYIPFAPRVLTRAAARTISRRQGNQVDALVVPSRAMLTALTAYGVSSRMMILPTGIPLTEQTGGDGHDFRRRYGIPPDRPLLLHVGRAAFEKNIDFLLKMFVRVRERHPRALLAIAGEGPALPHLKRLTRRLKLDAHVYFVGYLERIRALLDCYRAADLFVFASRTETQGLVLLEAMAQGLPVVALAEMGTLDILEDGQGALIAPPAEQDFAAQVCRILDSPALRKQLAASALAHVRHWEARELAQRLAEFYAVIASEYAHLRPDRASSASGSAVARV
ncbi:MAG: glycosyl transferase family 1 [Betaproteobacteria bacterium]|nr:glycosyl transferase family 1 [Betaproteobacteria bacterium]